MPERRASLGFPLFGLMRMRRDQRRTYDPHHILIARQIATQDFTATSRIEVGRKLVPARYDPFRLQVSPSYRELFDHVVSRNLDQNHWQIVRVR